MSYGILGFSFWALSCPIAPPSIPAGKVTKMSRAAMAYKVPFEANLGLATRYRAQSILKAQTPSRSSLIDRTLVDPDAWRADLTDVFPIETIELAYQRALPGLDHERREAPCNRGATGSLGPLG